MACNILLAVNIHKLFHTPTNPCHTRIIAAHQCPFLVFCTMLSWIPQVALSNLICLQKSLPWYSQHQHCWLHQVQSTVHRRLHKVQITVHNRSDSTGHIVENSVQMHSTEEREYDVATEYCYYVESVYWFHRGWNLYMKQRQNDMAKYQSKMIQNAITSHCRMPNRPIQSM